MTNWRILLTRLAAENITTGNVLAQNNIYSASLPLLKIRLLAENSKMLNILNKIKNYQAIVVVSKTAANLLVNLLKKYQITPHVKTIFFCVGAGSGKILQQHNLTVIYPPNGNNSEALIQNLQFQSILNTQANFLLVKGQGGRNLLSTTIKNANCNIDKLELYQRLNINYETAVINKIISKQQINGVFITSLQSLQNYHGLINNKLHQIALFVPSIRVANYASDYGFSKVYNCNGADIYSLLNALNVSN